MKTHVRQHMRRLPHSARVTTVTDHDRRLSKESLGGTMIRNPVRNGSPYWNFPGGKPAPSNYVWDGKGWVRNPETRIFIEKRGDKWPQYVLLVDGQEVGHGSNQKDLIPLRDELRQKPGVAEELVKDFEKLDKSKSRSPMDDPVYAARVRAEEHYGNTADERYEKNLRGRKVLHEGHDADLVAETPTRREWVSRVTGEVERERLVNGRWESE